MLDSCGLGWAGVGWGGVGISGWGKMEIGEMMEKKWRKNEGKCGENAGNGPPRRMEDVNVSICDLQSRDRVETDQSKCHR